MKELLIAVLILLGALVLGCRQSNDTSQNDPHEDKGQKTVSLQLQWVTQAQFAGYYLALDKGWFKDVGVEVEIIPGGPDIVPVDLVASGTRDFGTTLLADLALAVQRGKPVTSIAQIQQNNGLRLIARKTSQISSPKDFRGKKIGVWLGGWEVQFNALLARFDIPAESLNIISQGFSMTPFIQGRLDVASAMIYNEYHMVLESGIPARELIVIDYGDFELDFPGDVLFTSDRTIHENPELCRKMVKAALKGWQYALAHPMEAVDSVLKNDRSGVARRDHQEKMMGEISRLVQPKTPGRIGLTRPDDLARMIDLLVQYKVLGSAISPDMIFTNRFVEQ